MSDWENRVLLHKMYEGARSIRNSYFEKLAILDGGTVALVITAVLGPLHSGIKHKYSLGIGLSCLVVAMLTLLSRNLVASLLEHHFVAEASHNPVSDTQAFKKTKNWSMAIVQYLEIAGLGFSAIGIIMLLIQVWLILV